MSVKDLFDQKRYYEIWILSRYLYRIGEKPLLSDAQYDVITRALKEQYPEEAKEYLERTYDDDPIPYELLEEVNIKPVNFAQFEDRMQYASSLDEDKSLSINSVTSYEEAFYYLKDKKDKHLDIVISLKMDGVNHKDLFIKDELKLSMSRGRAGNGFDFTKQICNCLPNKINSGLSELKITGECYVTKEGVQHLREQYRVDKYKTSKSAAISMLRVKHALDDYKYLKAKVFYAEGLETRLDATFIKLAEMGFDVVPYEVISYNSIPDDLTSFKCWFRPILDRLYEIQIANDMPADGVVLQVNDLLWEDTISGQYSNKQLACKFEHWAFDVYKAKVTDIVITQRRVLASVRIRIEPIITRDDCEAQWINCFNPSILISNDIHVGTEVCFERNSGAVNILIHGKRLNDLINEKV